MGDQYEMAMRIPAAEKAAGIFGYISYSLQVSDRTEALPLRGEI